MTGSGQDHDDRRYIPIEPRIANGAGGDAAALLTYTQLSNGREAVQVLEDRGTLVEEIDPVTSRVYACRLQG